MGEFWQVRGVGFRESMFMALAIYGVARGGSAAAADAASKSELPRPQLAGPLLAHPQLAPSFSTAPAPLESEPFFPSEFRPRKSGSLEIGGARNDTRMTDPLKFQDTSAARQMEEFKSQDRLRLLTLWQNHASSVSIQAGKRGAPSLQWSTPLMHKDSGSRGLFDHLLAVSPQGAFGGARSTVAAHQSSVPTPAKVLELGTALKPP